VPLLLLLLVRVLCHLLLQVPLAPVVVQPRQQPLLRVLQI
jgi:hypothetical protein